MSKPQVIYRVSNDWGTDFIKKRPDGSFWLEGHIKEKAGQHNLNAPRYFLPLVQEDIDAIMNHFGR